jgi:uncharacterized membrane protein YedE/YeeE
MTNFTPVTALIGGAAIGLAAALLLWLNGRIAGVSGIAAGLWSGEAAQWGWRLPFLVGLAAGAAAWVALAGPAPAPRPAFPPWALALAGLLVGYGSALSGGCTSGHGVCGLARLSVRSLAATAVFLAAGIATTFVVRHLLHIA